MSEQNQLTVEALLERVAAPIGSELPLPRLLMVFAHPDDEVLAMGGRLERMAESHLSTLTDGAPLDGRDARDHGFSDVGAYREARARELFAALAHAGLAEDFEIDCPVGVSDQTAGYHLRALAEAVAEQIEALGPEAVLTHPYEGGHPDHDACAFAVHSAVRMISERGGGALPVLEAPFYHAGEDGSMRTGAFPHGFDAGASVSVRLSAGEAANKRARLACFSSQAETLAQFGVDTESFRRAPVYDFTLPPHPGQLLYERFGWGMTGDQFRANAREALRQMFAGEDEPTSERVPQGSACV